MCDCSCTTQNLAYALEDNEVAVIDEDAHQQIAAYPLPAGETGLSITADAGTGELYIGTNSGGGVLVMDAKTGALKGTIPSSGDVYDVLFMAGKVYHQESNPNPTNVLYFADPATFRNTGSYTAAAAIRDFVTDADEDRLYVSDENNEINVVNPETGAVTATISLPEIPVSLALDPANHRLFAVSQTTVYIMDTQTNAIIDSYATPSTSYGSESLSYNPNTNQLYLANPTDTNVLNADNGQVVDAFTSSSSGRGLDPVNNQYFYYNGSDTVMLNGADSSQLGSIAMNNVNGYAFARLEDCPNRGPTGATGATATDIIAQLSLKK